MRFPQAETGLQNLLEAAYPVGAIFTSTVDTDPALLLGFGTWQAFAAGRCLVGLDAAQAEFDALGKTGGAKAVTLTGAQSGMPLHTHAQSPHLHTVTDGGHSHTIPVGATDDTAAPFERADAGTNAAGANATTATGSATTGVTVNNATAVNQDAGPLNAAQAHDNLMPFVTVRFWKRVS